LTFGAAPAGATASKSPNPNTAANFFIIFSGVSLPRASAERGVLDGTIRVK
jgi:hypothetical protein